MDNACFRCRTAIPSGGTFCGQCRSAVSFGETTPEETPGWWKGVAVGTIGMLAYLLLAVPADLVGVSLPILVSGLLVASLMVTHFAGLYLDARALGGRPDVPWSPSDEYLAVLLFGSLFVITIPLVGGYYLVRRRQRIGLDA